MGTKSIDERLSEVVKFVCERDGLDPKTLKRTDGIATLFPKNTEEVSKIKDAISYVKTYAKIKEVSKLLSNEESVKADIEEAKKHFEQLIAETQKEIEALPKAPRKRKNTSLNYSFGNSFEEYAIDEAERAREARKKKLLDLRENITLYKKQLRRLDDLSKTLANPRMVVKKLFSDETMRLNGEYGKLVNMCALSMTKEDFEHLLSDDERNLFEFDGQDYTVDKGNARKFLSTIKSKKAVLAIANYAEKKSKYDENRSAYNKYIEDKKKYAEVRKVAETEEFAEVTAKMNEVSKLFTELEEAEEREMRGSLLHRVRNSIRVFFGFKPREVMFSRKLHAMKNELTDKMQDLLDYTRRDAKTKKAYDAYVIARRNIGEGNTLTYGDHLEWAIDSVRFNGTERTDWPRDTVSVEELKQSAKLWEEKSAEGAKGLEESIIETACENDEAYDLLPKRAQKILETSTPEDILKYAKKYYGYGNETDPSTSRLNTGISPSAAALILEGIIKRRNISYERMMEIYEDVVDKEQEQLDLEKMMSQKVDYIRSEISQMINNHPTKNVEAKEKPSGYEPDREAM